MLTVRCPKHPRFKATVNPHTHRGKAKYPCDVCNQLWDVVQAGQLEAANMGYLYGPQLTPRCETHPEYTGRIRNVTGCKTCEELYDLVHEPDFAA